MNRFAFMIHPLDLSDYTRKFPVMKLLPGRVVAWLGRKLPPVKASHITGVVSAADGTELEGWFVGCPLTAEQMMTLPTDYVLGRIIKTGQLAERLGAQILGLGAFTSVVGDAGVTVQRNLNIPVTTGNSYTVATAIQGARKAAQLMGIELDCAEVAVVGATGAIGRVVSEIIARDVRFMTLIGRNDRRLSELANHIRYQTGLAPAISNDPHRALPRADIVIAVSSAVEAIIQPEDLKVGAVVCDVARPRDVSKQVAAIRDDVLIIEGGVVEVPGDVEFNLNFGYPPKKSLACMAETMALALEGRFESYTLGRDITVEQVDEITQIAEKHGFRLSGFRSFERSIDQQTIEQTRINAERKRVLEA